MCAWVGNARVHGGVTMHQGCGSLSHATLGQPLYVVPLQPVSLEVHELLHVQFDSVSSGGTGEGGGGGAGGWAGGDGGEGQ